MILAAGAFIFGRKPDPSTDDDDEDTGPTKEQLAQWQRYSDQRKDLDAVSLELGARYDKLALAVSGGAFILSLTFLEKVTSRAPLWAGWILIGGWIALMTAIACHLLALRFSSRIQQRKIDDLDAEYISDRDLVLRTDTISKEIEKFTKYLRRTNETGMWSAILGILLIVVFSAIAFICDPKHNSNNKQEDNNEPKAKSERKEESAAPKGTDQGGGVIHPQQTDPTASEPKQGKEEMSAKKTSQPKLGSKGSYVPPPNAQKPPSSPPPQPKKDSQPSQGKDKEG